MKKILAVLTVLALLLAALPALAEETGSLSYAEEHPGAAAFSSMWAGSDGETWIEASCLDDRFEVLIIRVKDEKTFTSWEYLPDYDDATDTLRAEGGMKSENVAGEGNAIADSVYTYDDGSAVFSINADGQLVWQDAKEDAGAGLTFTRIGWFIGDYACGCANVHIRWTGERYAVDAEWGNSAADTSMWQMGGDYDPEGDRLPVQGFTWHQITDGNGEVDQTADRQETETSAEFTFDGEGHLIWTSPDGVADGLLFENLQTAIWILARG